MEFPDDIIIIDKNILLIFVIKDINYKQSKIHPAPNCKKLMDTTKQNIYDTFNFTKLYIPINIENKINNAKEPDTIKDTNKFTLNKKSKLIRLAKNTVIISINFCVTVGIFSSKKNSKCGILKNAAKLIGNSKQFTNKF